MLRMILFIISCAMLLNAQTAIIKGTVEDKSTNSPISNVNIYIENLQLGTTTDNQGNFELKELPVNKKINLTFSHIGYEIFSTECSTSTKTLELNIQLSHKDISLGEVTVSSSRFNRLLKDNAQPLEVINKKDIEQDNGISIPDFLQREPGISLMRDGIWGTDVTIRGLSKNNVVTLIDGNRIETATEIAAGMSLIDVNDIQRIEVIKGASSSLYGSGAVGGVVNIISKQSNYAGNYYINGSIQSVYNSVNKGTYSSLNIHTGDQNWNLKLTSSYRSASDIETPQGYLPNSRFHDNNISALFNLRLFENQELTINYQRSRAKDVGIPGGSAFPVTADVRYPLEKRDLISANYSIRNISSSFIKLNLKYYYQYIFRDVENIPHIVKNVPASGTTPAKRVSVLSITPSANHLTNGAQIQSDFIFGNQYLIGGIDFWTRSYDGHREKSQLIEVLNPSGDVVNSNNIIFGEKPLPDSRYSSLGVYLQDEISLSPKFKLTAGGRIDKIFISNEEALNPVYQTTNGVRNDTPPNQTVLWKSTDAQNTSWSTNINMLYKVGSETDLTFSLARSFRSPALEERYQYIDLGSYVRLGNPNLEPEEGYFLDAGIREWGENITMKANVFLNYMTNLVVEEPGTYEERAAFIKTNIGKARLYGFDVSCQYLLGNKIKIFSNASYVRGEDTREDKNLPQIAPLNGTLGTTIPFQDFADVTFSATLFDSQNKTAEGETATPGYAVFDLHFNSADINFGSFFINIYGGIENILDKSYRNHLATNRSFITAEPGRNFYLKLKLNW